MEDEKDGVLYVSEDTTPETLKDFHLMIRNGLPYGLGWEPGWNGMLTRNEAEGAFRNGTRVRKRNSEPNDTHPDGTEGTILGSIPNETRDSFTNEEGVEVIIEYLYFVEWDPLPKWAVGTIDLKVEGNGQEPVQEAPV